jgi:hypothetical protein
MGFGMKQRKQQPTPKRGVFKCNLNTTRVQPLQRQIHPAWPDNRFGHCPLWEIRLHVLILDPDARHPTCKQHCGLSNGDAQSALLQIGKGRKHNPVCCEPPKASQELTVPPSMEF